MSAAWVDCLSLASMATQRAPPTRRRSSIVSRLIAGRIGSIAACRTTIGVVNACADRGCADRRRTIIRPPMYSAIDAGDTHWRKWSPNSSARGIDGYRGRLCRRPVERNRRGHKRSVATTKARALDLFMTITPPHPPEDSRVVMNNKTLIQVKIVTIGERWIIGRRALAHVAFESEADIIGGLCDVRFSPVRRQRCNWCDLKDLVSSPTPIPLRAPGPPFRFCPQGIRRAIEQHNEATLARPVRQSSHPATGFNAASLRISAVKKRHQTGKRLALGGECGAA